MFSIYGPEGRAFHNTLEELYRLRQRVLNENPASTSTAESRRQADRSVNQHALAAYRELIHAQAKDELHHVYEVMSTEFVNLPADSSAYSALLKIQQSPFNELPVVNANNSIIGLISYRSVLGQLIDTGEELGFLKITPTRQFLTGDVITTEPVTSIRRAAQVMNHYDLETLPVVDSYGSTIGIITCKKVVSAVSNEPPLSIWS